MKISVAIMEISKEVSQKTKNRDSKMAARRRKQKECLLK
jgi:hypothetical protein